VSRLGSTVGTPGDSDTRGKCGVMGCTIDNRTDPVLHAIWKSDASASGRVCGEGVITRWWKKQMQRPAIDALLTGHPT
jgi:hypothetical protein